MIIIIIIVEILKTLINILILIKIIIINNIIIYIIYFLKYKLYISLKEYNKISIYIISIKIIYSSKIIILNYFNKK